MSTNSKIWLSSPHMSGEEIKFVNEAFQTNWVAPLGPNVNGFEQDLAGYTGVKHAAALVSGTSAIHLSLIMLDVKPGDEVICQSFTFSGSANPIMYQFATPIFIDSEEDTWNMSPEILEEAIQNRIKLGKKPKAIIFVHLYGMPAKIEEIIEIANKYEIPVIEDAAEALGSSYKNKKLGSFSDFSALSFNGNKIITTSGGGALLSDKEEIIKKARYLSTQARENALHYEHTEVGYNYRMSNIVAGIGRGQMTILDERVNKRREIFDWYKQLFENIEGIVFQPELDNSFSNRWLTAFYIDESKLEKSFVEKIRLALEKDNIESRPLWKPMHLQPVFNHTPFYGNGTCQRMFETGLCLPSGSNMTEKDFERIESAIKSVL